MIFMTTKPKAKSRILEAVHETARDLHRLGFIDKRKMQKYDVLCLEPVQDYDAVKVKALRERLNLSQAVLASVLNTSASTVRKWEVGDKRPSGPSQRLLDIIESARGWKPCSDRSTDRVIEQLLTAFGNRPRAVVRLAK